MRTRAKSNVIDAVSFPIDGAAMDNNKPVIGGVVVPDLNGVQQPAIIVNGDEAYLFPAGRTFEVVGGPNAGTYTVQPPGALFNTFPLAPHIERSTEIPVLAVTATSAGGDIFGFGINCNTTFINDLQDPVDLQDAVTKNYVDNEIINTILPLLAAVMPPGSIVPWAGSAVGAPSSWLLCDGSSHDSVADTTLTDLFANIGTTYGGTGASDFNVPDLRGRFPLGKSNGSGSNRVNRVNAQSLANIDGDEGVTLTTVQMPSHGHTGSTAGAGSHTHTGSTGASGAHSHDVRMRSVAFDVDASFKPEYPLLSGTISDRFDTEPDHTHPLTSINPAGNHTHTITVDDTVGGDNTHNNVPPHLTIQYIIKI